MTDPEAAFEHAADVLEQNHEADRTAALLADELGFDARTPEAQQAWEVDGDNTAQWAIDKIAAATEERDRIRRNAQDAIEQIQAKALRDEARSTRTIEFMTGKLIDYRRRLEAENPKLPKTYPLPNGDLCVRAGRPSVKVIDEGAFVDWAVDHAPQALTYKPKVTGLKHLDRGPDGVLVTDAGEQVPGVREVQGEPSYSVKPNVQPEPF